MRYLAALLVILGLVFMAAPASADAEWIRVNKVTARDKVTDDIVVYTTIWYKSGTTQPGRKGKMVIKPIKQNIRYIDYRNNSCDKAVAELDNISFQTTFKGGNATQKLGARRIACNPDGQDSFAFKLDSPTFRYFKNGFAPEFDTKVHVTLKNWDDKNGYLDGRMWWLELATPSLRPSFG